MWPTFGWARASPDSGGGCLAPQGIDVMGCWMAGADDEDELLDGACWGVARPDVTSAGGCGTTMDQDRKQLQELSAKHDIGICDVFTPIVWRN